ncbi:hypothetical protein SAMN03080598_03917 [Algoriphagus boritolerans DSM 17298 = JCM 18970]|uniref:Uncharacterized protein n=1 Tax=Algoriphagus boritolerans DSM 17298 = JCM 18970 TaxID=1120964 RepID=A0A1H6A5E1_9BACT|nr:hypothetical protein SAMN03080598_03917 [Algoriphagus boritolerans DSM 17298 = JCM 18970]
MSPRYFHYAWSSLFSILLSLFSIPYFLFPIPNPTASGFLDPEAKHLSAKDKDSLKVARVFVENLNFYFSLDLFVGFVSDKIQVA